MSSPIKEIAIPEGDIKNPKGLLKSAFSKLFLGSRFAIGLVIFLVGVMIVVMLARRSGLPLPTKAISNLTG